MNQLGNLAERPRLYYNIDGLGELGGGVMFVGCALLLWRLIQSPANSVWHRISIFLFVGFMLVIHYGTKTIKTHITYPRTGFVEYRKRRRSAIVAAAIAALTTLSVFVIVRRHWDSAAPALLIAPAFTAVYAYSFAREVRWKWGIVAAMAVACLFVAMAPGYLIGALANDKLAGTVLVCLLVFGTLLLISGGISFWLYLRHTPPPVQDAP